MSGATAEIYAAASHMKRLHCPTCSCEVQGGIAVLAGLVPWRLAQPIADAISKTRFVGLAGDEIWWRSQFRARNGVRFDKALLEAEAWCASNPGRAPKKAFRRFLNSWFQRAAGDES